MKSIILFAAFGLTAAPGGPGGDAPPGANVPERDPQEVFRKVWKAVSALEAKHPLLKEISAFDPVIERDEEKGLRSAEFIFSNNALPPGKEPAKAKDAGKPFFYVSVQVWVGNSDQPAAGMHQFRWKGETYQMWVRVFGSDPKLVETVRKTADEAASGPATAPPP